jgi:hypothetical protein
VRRGIDDPGQRARVRVRVRVWTVRVEPRPPAQLDSSSTAQPHTEPHAPNETRKPEKWISLALRP